MLQQGIFGRLFNIIWFVLVAVIVLVFIEDFARWFVANITSAKAWAALVTLLSVLFFTNQNLILTLIRGLRSATGAAGVQAGGRVENRYFWGRPPLSLPVTGSRLPLAEGDMPLSAERAFLETQRNLCAKKGVYDK